MSSLFGGTPKMTKEQKAAQDAQLRSQRKQDQSLQQQGSDEAKELGARRRLAAARAAGRDNLFSTSGAAGVQDTLG